MFDGWEGAHDCLDRKWADLAGYRRSFNKKSVKSRGTRDFPGLTLNLTPSHGAVCRGRAFEFADGDKSHALLKLLAGREACDSRELSIRLEDGRNVIAHAFIYKGPNLIDEAMSLSARVDMVRTAQGERGSGLDYVRILFEGLKSIGIDDPAVSELWKAIHLAPNHAVRVAREDLA